MAIDTEQINTNYINKKKTCFFLFNLAKAHQFVHPPCSAQIPRAKKTRKEWIRALIHQSMSEGGRKAEKMKGKARAYLVGKRADFRWGECCGGCYQGGRGNDMYTRDSSIRWSGAPSRMRGGGRHRHGHDHDHNCQGL